MELPELTIHQALESLARKDFTSVQLTEAYLDRIERLEPTVQAYLTITAERALADAQRADERRARGESAPLLGVPIALKDIFCTSGIETTCASRILKGFVPPYDA